ncbi:MAG: glycosyltransferase family 4 protein, partial [Alphaproteobacteria bacterium]|nr:glycosyltransferase family 4 protein [Alphaproteobacteria bacterium]
YECNNKMKGICASKHFKHLIVTQKIMYDYFVENGICPKEKITLIFGGCGFPVYSEKQRIINEVSNICFVSNNYGNIGWIKKGYDIFISTARKLIEQNKNLKFHVIGYGFDEKAIDISDINEAFIYHERVSLKTLKSLLEKMDMMIMPNRPQYFNDGGLDIDGFPIGTAAYGMMCGCPMFMTDPFDLNNGFYEDGKDFVKINFDSDEIAQKVQYYIDNPKKLNEIGQNGGDKTRELISFDRQIKPRLEIYRRLLEEYK